VESSDDDIQELGLANFVSTTAVR